MAVMNAPRAHQVRQAAAEPDAAAARALRQLRNTISNGTRKAEILEGRLVVSPAPVLWHERACRWLDLQFSGACEPQGWLPDRDGEIELLPPEDVLQPGLMIVGDAASLPQLESVRPLDHVLLVAEVVSPSSIRDDREVNPFACARAGVPMYLLVDRLTDPVTVTLWSEPTDAGYRQSLVAARGEKLPIPAPFGFSLDTATLPLPRQTRNVSPAES